MEQIGRSATHEEWGYLHPCRYVLHDRDTKFCESFRSVLAMGGVKTIRSPAKSPNLNAFAERWVRSVKQECLSKLILFGETSLWRVLTEYSTRYHSERNRQGKGQPNPVSNAHGEVSTLQGFTSLPASSGWAAQILRASRMSTLTTRGCKRKFAREELTVVLPPPGRSRERFGC
jgi:hypothetical protein